MTDSPMQEPAAAPGQALLDLASQHGLLGPGETEIGDALWAYTMGVVSLCARLADLSDGGSPGDGVRAALLDYRTRQARTSGPQSS